MDLTKLMKLQSLMIFLYYLVKLHIELQNQTVDGVVFDLIFHSHLVEWIQLRISWEILINVVFCGRNRKLFMLIMKIVAVLQIVFKKMPNICTDIRIENTFEGVSSIWEFLRGRGSFSMNPPYNLLASRSSPKLDSSSRLTLFMYFLFALKTCFEKSEAIPPRSIFQAFGSVHGLSKSVGRLDRF